MSDKNLKRYLMKETDYITIKKDEVWKNVHQELFVNKERKNRKKRFFIVVTVAAIFIFIWAGLMTTPGQALVQNLKEMFVEKKSVDIEIEGEKENTDVDVEINEELKYVIYVDRSRYKLIEEGDVDKIVPVEELGEQYPVVEMEILTQETTIEKAVDLIRDEMFKQRMTIKTVEKVNEPIKSTMVIGYGGKDEIDYEWDTPIYRY